MKRAQVTGFIIIGLILVAVIAILLNFQQTGSLFFLGESQRFQVQSYVENCMTKTAEYGLLKLGERGGHLDKDPVTYLVSQDQVDVLTIEEVQEDLEEFIEANIDTCLDGFAPLEEKGIQITTKRRSTGVLFTVQDTRIKLDYPLESTKKQKIETFKSFQVKLPVRFRPIYQAAVHIAATYANTRAVDMTYLASTDVETHLYQQPGEQMVVVVTDSLSKIQKKEYFFQFGLHP